MSQKIEVCLSYDDVLLVPQHSEVDSRSEVDLTTQISPKIRLKIPLISANVDTVTGTKMAIQMGKLGGLGILPRFEAPEDQANKVREVKKKGVIAAASIGIREGEMERVEMLVKAGAEIINIDVAHGHMQKAIEATARLREKYGNSLTLISGIVATGKGAQAHYEAGADCVGVGVGGGSTCTTRIETGSGLPTFASLLDIAPVARRYGKTFIPLAGVKNAGDIVKSLAAGASAIWAGNLFAGCEEAPGELVEIDGKKYKRYHGSTSEEEKENHLKNGNGQYSKSYVLHIEGVAGYVLYKGPVEKVVKRLLASIRSGLSYSGARNIRELWKKAEFVKITANGVEESGPHGIFLKED